MPTRSSSQYNELPNPFLKTEDFNEISRLKNNELPNLFLKKEDYNEILRLEKIEPPAQEIYA